MLSFYAVLTYLRYAIITTHFKSLPSILNAYRFFFRPQPGSAYMPINVDGSPGRSFRGGPPCTAPIQVTAPPQGLGRSGSPANGPGSSVPATAASLIRTPYSNYAVASAVAQANHKGITPPQGTAVDPVRYYQGVAAAAAANNLPAVASLSLIHI